MVDTVHIQRSLERNLKMGIGDFYLAKLGNGQVVTEGSLNLREVQVLISKQILFRDSLETTTWLPTCAPPNLPMPIEKLGSQPTMLKKTAVSYKNWLLSVVDVKPGESDFLGWHFPLDRVLFVATDNIMPGVSNSTFTMSDLVKWEELSKIKNGFGSGSTSLLERGTGISSWLGFLKVFIEVYSSRDVSHCIFVKNLFHIFYIHNICKGNVLSHAAFTSKSFSTQTTFIPTVLVLRQFSNRKFHIFNSVLRLDCPREANDLRRDGVTCGMEINMRVIS